MQQPTITPDYLWNELHVNRQESAQASRLALSELNKIDTQNFANLNQAKMHNELARIAVVTALVVAKKAKYWDEAKPFLTEAIKVVINHYPFTHRQAEREKRIKYWQQLFAGRTAELICLRDVFHLIQFLQLMISNDDLVQVKDKVFSRLTELSRDKEERFGLIFIIESEDYQLAKDAFKTYMTHYGPSKSAYYHHHEFKTVQTRVLIRAIIEDDHQFLSEFPEQLVNQHQKKVLQKRKQEEKIKSWSAQTNQPDLLNILITNLIKALE